MSTEQYDKALLRSPKLLAAHWEAVKQESSRPMFVANILAAVATIGVLSSDLRNVPPAHESTVIMVRVLVASIFVVLAFLVKKKPDVVRRRYMFCVSIWWAGLTATVTIISLLLFEPASGLYYAGIVQAEIAIMVFFRMPSVLFLFGTMASNATFVGINIVFVDELPATFFDTVSVMIVFAVLAIVAQRLVFRGSLVSFLQRREIRASQLALQRTFDRITDAFFALDRNWKMTFLNDSARKMLQRAEVRDIDLIGVQIWEAFPALAKQSNLHNQLLESLETMQPVVFTEMFPLLGRQLEVHAYPAEDGLSVYCHDVTETVLLQQTKQLRMLSAKLTSAREAERARIAREVHDELGQVLSVLRLEVGGLEQKMAPDQSEFEPGFERVYSLVDRALFEVRQISAQLRPAILDDLGLDNAIEWIAETSLAAADLEMDLTFEADSDDMPEDMRVTIFRVVQESCTNVIRHAMASRVDVRVVDYPEYVAVSVCDDGIGLDQSRDLTVINQGNGITGMRERVIALGGQLELERCEDGGVRVVATLPKGEDATVAQAQVDL